MKADDRRAELLGMTERVLRKRFDDHGHIARLNQPLAELWNAACDKQRKLDAEIATSYVTAIHNKLAAAEDIAAAIMEDDSERS